MSPDRRCRVEQLLDEALDLPPGRRADYLARACVDSPELRAEVASLLAHYEQAERAGFLRWPPATGAGTDPAVGPDAAGETDGPAADRVAVPGYEVLSELGRGGMGVVYLARDPDLNRTLAIKVLSERHRGQPDLERRFLEEAQLTGQLQHPAVPPVHEVGRLADGRPFFAMRLVQGRTFADLLRGRRDPAEELPRFVAIFGQVCQAVAYAHSRGVIHRDLKPANVMVGAFGEVQVMDWGLAKLLAPADGRRQAPASDGSSAIATVRTLAAGTATEAGAVLGTLAYMAPEQAQGEVDTVDERGDVFGLGAILCEVLTGLPPYHLAAGSDLCRQAAQAELADAHARLDGCGADAELVRLARACLAAAPAGRPRDASAVAEAVAAYQAGVAERLRRAELARTAAEVRAGEERKRRRLAVLLATAVLGLVLLAGGGAVWAVRQREQTRRGVETLMDQAWVLQQQFRWAEAKATVTQAASRLEEGGPSDLHERVRQAQENLEWAARLDAIRLARSDFVEGQFANATAATRYAEIFGEAGLEVVAEPAAVAARIRASAIRDAWVAALDDWALATKDATLRARLFRVAREANPDIWRDQLRDPSMWKDRAALEHLAAEAATKGSPQLLTVLGQRLLATGGDATPMLRTAQQRYPTDFWLNYILGFLLSKREPETGVGFLRAALVARPTNSAVYNDLGNALAATGHLEEAIAAYREALRLAPDLAKAHTNLGSALYKKGRLEEAIAAHRAALRLNPKLASAHNNLGNALAARGGLEEAIAAYREALRLDRKLAFAHTNLGRALKSAGRLEEAIAAYRAALRLDPKRADAHTNLGLALYAAGSVEEAIAAYRAALRLDSESAEAHYSLGIALKAVGRLDEAIAAYREAVKLKPEYAEAHCNLGNALRDSGRLADALECLRRGHHLGLKKPGWRERYPSEQWVRRCEHLLALEKKLPALLRGDDRPANPAEQLAVADLCRLPHQRLYGAAARWYAEAFAGDPKLAANLSRQSRFQAAGAAVLSAAGRGADATPPTDRERTRLRQQALDWLRADLAAWGKQAQARPQTAAKVRLTLERWRRHPDLASVRDADALAQLPDTELPAWQQLWAEVDRLLTQAKDVK